MQIFSPGERLIPRPAVLRECGGGDPTPVALAVVVDGLCDPDAASLRRLCGMVIRDWMAPPGVKSDATLSMRMEPGLRLPEMHGLSPDVRLQSYRLETAGSMIRLTAPAMEGLRLGLQTLRQLLEDAAMNGTLPRVDIRDWPRLALRGMHVDLAREMAYRPAYFRQIVERCAYFKFNQLHLYLENRLVFPSAPSVAGAGAMTVRQARQLRDYAAGFGVAIVPQIQTLGHMEQLLHGPYAGLRETPASASNLCPTHPAARDFLAGMMADAVAAFEPAFLHVGYDESQSGRCPRCRAAGSPWQVLGDHLNWIHSEASRHRVELMIYADMFLPRDELPLLDSANCPSGREAREALRRVPRDLVITNWHYFSPHARSGRWLRQEGFERVVCTTASSLFTSDAIRLVRGGRWIAETMKQDIADGAMGALNCNWEMYRGQTLENAWILNALAADRGWSSRPHDPVTWPRRFSARFFGVDSEEYGYLLDLVEVIPAGRTDQFLDRHMLDAEIVRPMPPVAYGWVGLDHPETGDELMARAKAFRRRAVRNRRALACLDMPGAIIRYVGLRVRQQGMLERALKAGRKREALEALQALHDEGVVMRARLDRLYRRFGNALEDRGRIERQMAGLRDVMGRVRRHPARELDRLTLGALIHPEGQPSEG